MARKASRSPRSPQEQEGLGWLRHGGASSRAVDTLDTASCHHMSHQRFPTPLWQEPSGAKSFS